MFKYAIVEISGRQYKVTPQTSLLVDFLGNVKNFECEKILLKVEGDKLELGRPFIKEKLIFDVLEQVRKPKVTAMTYKAKANTRRVKGSRRLLSKIKLTLS